MRKFRCPACGGVLLRDYGGLWVKSYCSTSGRMVKAKRVIFG